MRRTFLTFASGLLAIACGRIEVDPDASETAIDSPIGDGPSSDGTTIDGPPSTIDAATIDGAVVDARPIDAPSVDAPPPTAPFDIAYTNRWDIIQTTGVGASQTGLIINKSTTGQSMALPMLQVISSTDDHPTATFTFSILNAATYTLPAQQAGGLLAGSNGTFVNPLVNETRFDTNRPTFDFSLSNIPSGLEATINASAQVRHGNQVVTLTWAFRVSQSGTFGGRPTAANRLSSVFMP